MAKPHIRLRSDAGGFRTSASSDGFDAGSGSRTAHDGASLTARDVASWSPIRRSADAEILPEWGAMVGRTRDLDRNNPVAKGARRTITDNVIGSGLRLSARPDYAALGESKEWATEWGKTIEARWRSYWWTTACHAGDTLTGDQLVTMAKAAEIMNGGSLTLPLWIPERGDGYATKLQLIEVDRLSNPWGKSDSRYLRGGVAIDDYGAPQGYWIRKSHPGDYFVGGSAGLIDDWEFVPRRVPGFNRLRVVHCYDPERSEQTRGKPLMSCIIPQLKNADRYVRAELDAAVANALIAGIMTTPLSGDEIVDLFSKDHTAYLKARQEHAIRLQGGTIMTAFPGDDFKSHIPARPASGFGVFTENIHRIAGVALDLPYELLLKDFSKSNYSSARAALLEAWRSFNRQRDWLGTMWLDPIYGLFVEELINDGRIAAPRFYEPGMRAAYLRCRWIGPGRGWVDPAKEIEAAKGRIVLGVSTLEDECAEQGRDWRETLEQQALEAAERERLGLPSLTDMIRAGNGGGPAAGSAAAPDPEDAADTAGASSEANQPVAMASHA